METVSGAGAADARRPRPRATMRDVASLAGVGIKTVSRVVNGESGVAEATRQRVGHAAQALDFQLDLRAGSLRRAGRRSLSLGLVLASVDNPHCAAIHGAVEKVAAERGVALLSASTDERPDRERAMVAALTARRVDGLIMTSTGADQGYLRPELASGTPVVVVDRPPVGIEVDSVVADNALGAQHATAHLLRVGHRRIAYLGDLSVIATARERLAGYRVALARAGIAVDETLIVEDLHDETTAYAAVHRLLNRSAGAPTALFTSQNLITISAIRALRSLAKHDRVALVGFDDFPLADLLEPAVTVVAQDPVTIGRTAAQRVFARLDGSDLPPERLEVPTRLVVRGSGEIPPPHRRT